MQWSQIGRIRVDDASVLIGSVGEVLAEEGRIPSALPERLGVGVDLHARSGISAVVVPSGAGDGIYPVEVATEVIDGYEVVAQVRVRFFVSESEEEAEY